MRRWGIVIVVLGLLVLGSGCNKVTTDKNQTSTSDTAIKTIDYTQLSSSEKDEMNFEFIRHDQGDSSAVDMKVINRTSKNIHFDGSKFLLRQPKGSDVTSNEDHKIIVKSNSTKTVKNLFAGISDTDFDSLGLYCYKNQQNKLAYSEIGTATSKSTNLKDEDLQKAFKKSTTKKKVSAKSTDSTKTPVEDNQTKQKTPAKKPIPVGQIITAKMAMDMVESQNGPAPQTTAYCTMGGGQYGQAFGTYRGQQVFWVRLYRNDGTNVAYLDDWTVYQDRTIVHAQPGSQQAPLDNDENADTSDQDNDGPSDDDQGNNVDSNDQNNSDDLY